MSNDEIERLDELWREATPGAWRAVCRDVGYKGGAWPKDNFLQWEVVGPDCPWGRGDFHQNDARLIAALHNLWPEIKAVLPVDDDDLSAAIRRELGEEPTDES